MDERFNAAMDKVRDEMAERGEGPAGVGEIVTNLLPHMPALAEAVLKEGKTLSDCYKTLEKYAREHKRGSCYYMPPGEAIRLICEYYGLEAGAVDVKQPAVGAGDEGIAPTGNAGAGDEGIAPTGSAEGTKRTDAGSAVDALDDLLEGL